MAKGTKAFVITGPWFTKYVRTLWADEGKHEQAVGTLATAFPDMPTSDVMAIITGSKQLIGDSTVGIELVVDNTERSPQDNPLTGVSWAPLERSHADVGDEPEDEPEDEPKDPLPTPTRTVTNHSGWLSPEGKFYACAVMGHVGLADQLGYTEDEIEKLGWIKISTGEIIPNGCPPNYFAHGTQAQKNILWDYCQEHGKKYPYWLEEDY